MIAAQNGNIPVMLRLLGPPQKLTSASNSNHLSGALVLAAEKGLLEVVVELVAAGANMLWTHQKRTALVGAASGNHFHVVEYLLAHGAAINDNLFRGWRGPTPVRVAVENEHFGMAAYLIERGADADQVMTRRIRKGLQERLKAFFMGTHRRLRRDSPCGFLPTDVIWMIARHTVSMGSNNQI
eukprot:c19527_g1_i4.p1 GENE.c19527_g1_i4~~c19527_g1_i4.p1  ORF type:complete len:183 (+),score=29.59 c19527_g1_i4:274-822(+)